MVARRLSAPLIIALMLVLAPVIPNAVRAEDAEPADGTQTALTDRVTLNADRVSYNDETGQASAQGGAVLMYQGTTIQAERIEYDAETQKVDAMPLPGQQVILTQGGRSLVGERLNYDLVTQEGVLSGPGTNIPLDDGVLYVKSGEISVLPRDMAVERGLISANSAFDGDYVAEWRNVKLTTCALEHPHYRLESKSMSFIPGRSVIAAKPRIYLGETYLFTSPLDYVVQLKRRAMKYSFIPYAQRTESHGMGGGINSAFSWETGSFSVGFSWAKEPGMEWNFELEQDLNDYFTALVGVNYTWDDVWKETIWRPYASLIYERDGWKARVNWTKDEYYEDKKDANYKYKGRINRKPEFIVNTPWFKTTKYSWLTLSAGFGSYSEETALTEGEETKRYGVGLRNYFEIPLSEALDSDPVAAEVFSNTAGYAWFYDKDSDKQQMLHSISGLRYRFGVFELGSAYERRYTWGESAMLWDEYRDAERIHQKLRFPLGREIYAAFRGSYDLKESMLDDMIYSLQWVTDCMKWDLHYRDDRTSSDDDSIGLTMSILAFPNTSVSFGQKMYADPFDRPSDMPKE